MEEAGRTLTSSNALSDTLAQPLLTKGQEAHLWRDIRLLSEAKKAPKHTYITKEIIGDHQIIHAILPIGMAFPGSGWSGPEVLIFAAYTALAVWLGMKINGHRFPKNKIKWIQDDLGHDPKKPLGCRKCGTWYATAQEYINHFKQVHDKSKKEN